MLYLTATAKILASENSADTLGVFGVDASSESVLSPRKLGGGIVIKDYSSLCQPTPFVLFYRPTRSLLRVVS